MNTVAPAAAELAPNLLAYLRKELKEPTLNYAKPLTQLQGGYETYTYHFALTGALEHLLGPLVLRLYPAFFGAQNAVWESTVQRVLAGTAYPVPQVYLTCTDLTILGGAFFIMAFLPGQPLLSAPPESVPIRLGQTHAALHGIDPGPLCEALKHQGIAPEAYRLDRRMRQLREQSASLPWLEDVVRWLFDQRPPEPETLAICHGDFHPLNILIDGDEVTAVLDWPGFLIADPVLDVATTLLLITIPAKHAAATLPGMEHVNWDQVGQLYLAAYQTGYPIDLTHLPYYQARRAAHALLEGARGQVVWQQPGVIGDLLELLRKITGIQVVVPKQP
ncbi:MAG: phosphotransferase family protein [Caldilineaceae bacterium]